MSNPTVLHEKRQLLQIAAEYLSPPQLVELERAIEFAEKSLSGRRDSGEPKICHSLSVAKLLAYQGADLRTLIAGVYHDLAEDSSLTLEDVERESDCHVAFLVDGVTKVPGDPKATLQKLERFGTEDSRVFDLKLMDRLHNMRTLNGIQDPLRRRKIAVETLQFYVPLAYRRQMKWIGDELHELALPHIQPHRKQCP